MWGHWKRAGLVAWGVFGAVNTMIGLAGIPDDVTRWATWLQPLDSELGRWIAGIVGLAVLANAVHLAEAVRMLTGRTESPRALLGHQGRLDVATSLEEDAGFQPSRQFRIRVRLREGEGEIRAFAEQVVDAVGRPISGFATLPVQLHWTHHDGQPMMRLSAAQASGDTFGLCAVRILGEGSNQRLLVITGDRIEPAIPRFFEDNRIVWILVGITVEKERVEHWFSFEPNETPPMFCRARFGTPPSIMG